MKVKTLAASLALIGATSFSGLASAIPITGELTLAGLGGSRMLCSTNPCTVASWTGFDFGSLNFYADTTGSIASFLLAGPAVPFGLANMSDPVNFSSPGALFRAGNLRFTWDTVSLSSSAGGYFGATFYGTMSQVIGNQYSPTPYTIMFSTQGNGASWSAQVPVPGTLALLGLGLAGVGLLRRQRSA